MDAPPRHGSKLTDLQSERWTATATALSRIWRRLLGVPRIGLDDDFFALGGDSFRASRLAVEAGRLFGVDLPVTLAFDRPRLRGQAAWIDAQAGAAVAPADPPYPPDIPAGGSEHRLTTQQREFLDWMAATDPPRDPGTVCTALRLHEPFDPELLRRALDQVTGRHSPLRSAFRTTPAGRLVPSTAAHRSPVVEVVDAHGETAQERERHAAQLARAARDLAPDLLRDPLVHALAIRLAPDDWVLVLAVHHFVFDGWSLGVLLRELGLRYSALQTGHGDPLPPLTLDHDAYCDWTARQWTLNRPYWKQALHGAPRALEPFPGRREARRFSRRRHPLTLAAPLWARFRERVAAAGGTAFMGAAACWTAVLHEWTGADDIVLMSPVPGRTLPEHDALIGCLVQSLLIRVDTSGRPDFAVLLGRVRTAALGAAHHQFHAYHETARQVPYPARVHYESWGGSPFFPGLRSEAFALPREQQSLDWPTPPGEPDLSTPELIAEERPDGTLEAAVVHNHHAFDGATAAALAEAFRAHVEAVAHGQEPARA